MIFDKDYDTSLWYIIRADKKNRKEIADFIKEIPKELLEKIHTSIKKVKEKESNSKESFLERWSREQDFTDAEVSDYCASENNFNIYYSYLIDFEGCLVIRKVLRTNGREEELFELMLLPVSQKQISLLGNFEDEWLGTITHNIKTKFINNIPSSSECDESEYSIYKTPVGYFVGYNREIIKNKKEIGIYKPIIRKVPEDINIDNLLVKKISHKR